MGGHRRRRILALASSFCLANAAFVACVGDSPDSSGGGGDSGSDASTTGDQSVTSDGPTVVPTATTTDATVYVGHPATLDGTASTPAGASFSWSLKSAPAGSSLTTASLQNASSSKVTLVPDLPGDFVVTLTVTASGGSASSNATVHAAPGKALYIRSHEDDASVSTTEVHFIRTDRTGDVAITCATRAGISGTGGLADSLSNGGTVDWTEGAITDPARVAFGYGDNLPDGGVISYVAAGTSDARCDGIHTIGHVDVRADSVSSLAAPPTGVRLSPNGSRIAYLRENSSSQYVVTTIGFDGNDKHVFGTLAYNDAGASQSGPTNYTAPRWIDDTHIAWVETVGPQNWRVVTAADVTSPTPGVYMTCSSAEVGAGFGTQAGVYEFEILPDGSVLVSAVEGHDANASTTLVVYKPNASTGACDRVRTLTPSDSDATDFSLSPDKTRIAYVSSAGNQASIWVVPIDGSSPPVRIPGQPDGGAVESQGPRWVADGAWVVWGVYGTYVSSPGQYAVGAASTSGGPFVPVAVPDASTDSYYAAGNTCAFSPPRSGGDLRFGLIVGLGALLAGRRRKKSTAH